MPKKIAVESLRSLREADSTPDETSEPEADQNAVTAPWLPAMDTIGARLKRRREAKAWSVRELADRSGVDKSAISRMEQGKSVSHEFLVRVCHALTYHFGQLMQEESDEVTVRIQQRDTLNWGPMGNIEYSLIGDPARLTDTSYRQRMGRDGAPMDFVSTLSTTPGGGRLVLSVRELYGEEFPLKTHWGEEAVYVLRGRLRLRVSGREYLLEEGDSAGFYPSEPHSYEPADKEDRAALPTVILCMVARPETTG